MKVCSALFISLLFLSENSSAMIRGYRNGLVQEEKKKDPIIQKDEKVTKEASPKENQISFVGLSESTVINVQDSFLLDYDRIRAKALDELNKCLVEHTVTDPQIDEKKGKALISNYLEAGYLNSKDLLWIIKEYSKPEKIDAKFAEELFNYIIINNIKNDDPKNTKQNLVMGLLCEIDIHRDYSIFDSNKTRSEKRNVLIESLVNGYTSALLKIIEVWPSDIIFYLIESVKREEKEVKSKGWIYNDYEYKDKSYNVISWIMRKGYLPNNDYADVAKSLLHRVFYVENSKKKIDVLFFYLASLLSLKNNLPEGIKLEELIPKLKNISDINIKVLSPKQVLDIEKYLEEKGVYKSEWKELIKSLQTK